MLNIFLKPFICFLQFANELPSRLAPLIRMPAIADMTPREGQTTDVYMEEVRNLFAEWQAFTEHNPS